MTRTFPSKGARAVARWRVALASLFTMLLLGGVSPAHAVDETPVLGMGPPCTVLMTSAGTMTGSAGNDHIWFLITQAVAKFASDDLSERGFRIVELIKEKYDEGQQPIEMFKLMQSSGCEKVLQIAYVLTPAPDNPHVVAAVTFSVSAFHLEEKGKTAGGTSVLVAGEYARDYRYPVSPEALKHLVMSDVGDQIAKDADAAKALVRPPGPAAAARP